MANHTLTAEICDEFVRARVDGKPITLKELAVRHGRSYPALRKAASDGEWSNKAAIASAERDTALAKTITERNVVTASLMEESVGREIDVRLRHALHARSLQNIALERLAAMCPKDLSPTLALQMLRVGIEEERLALGLSEVGKNVCDVTPDDRQHLHDAILEARAIMERLSPIGGAP